jgi:hypothetical protein
MVRLASGHHGSAGRGRPEAARWPALSSVKQVLTQHLGRHAREPRDRAGGSKRAADGGREEPNRLQRSVEDSDY